MADDLKRLALKAQSAVAALLAEAESQNKLWPDDVAKLSGALGVAQRLAKKAEW